MCSLLVLSSQRNHHTHQPCSALSVPPTSILLSFTDLPSLAHIPAVFHSMPVISSRNPWTPWDWVSLCHISCLGLPLIFTLLRLSPSLLEANSCNPGQGSKSPWSCLDLSGDIIFRLLWEWRGGFWSRKVMKLMSQEMLLVVWKTSVPWLRPKTIILRCFGGESERRAICCWFLPPGLAAADRMG